MKASVYSSKLLNAKSEVQTGWILQSFQSLSSSASVLFSDSDEQASSDSVSAGALPGGLSSSGVRIFYVLFPFISVILGYAGWTGYRRGQHGVRLHPAPEEKPSHNGVFRK